MGCRQCLLINVAQLKGKHCRKPHCCDGVVDTFEHCALKSGFHWTFLVKEDAAAEITSEFICIQFGIFGMTYQ